jgi:hypothetical protein
MIDRREVVEYLAHCPGGELTSLLAEAFARRPETGRLETGWEDKLVFAIADRALEDDGTWDPWTISLIAEADPDAYDPSWRFGNGEPFLQMGRCEACGFDLASHAKQVRCPVCRAPLILT